MGPTSCLKKCCAWPIIIIYNSPSGINKWKKFKLNFNNTFYRFVLMILRTSESESESGTIQKYFLQINVGNQYEERKKL